MSVEIRVPQLPESVADATLSAWHKQIGQPVRRDENLGDLETDKVVLEIPAPVSGVLREIKVQAGTSVKSGALLALIEEGVVAATSEAQPAAARSPALSAPAATAPAGGASAPSASAADVATAPPVTAAATGAAAAAVNSARQPPSAAGPQAALAKGAQGAPRVGPAARRVLAESKLSTGALASQPDRLSKADAMAAVQARPSTPSTASEVPTLGAVATVSQPSSAPAPRSTNATPSARPMATPEPPTAAPARARASTVGDVAPATGRPEQRVPMSRLRARVAERLLQAQATQALLTTFNEVDLAAVQELRNRHKEAFEKQYGVKLGLMSFFVKATIEALRRFPIVNAAVDGSDIVYHDYFDIGVAVSTDRGLMVPVLRDADAMSYADIEQQIAQYASRAREGSITLDELTGGTFSITNGGIFGSLMSTPIVNAPQSAILGMHKVQERAVVLKGEIAVRPMMYVALTYDHRIIDGRDAVQFLVTIKDCLEDPGRLLLGI